MMAAAAGQQQHMREKVPPHVNNMLDKPV